MAQNNTIANEDFYYELVAKELSGEISSAEKQVLLEWVNKEPGNRLLYESFEKKWKVFGASILVHSFDTTAAWEKVQSRLNVDNTFESTGKSIGTLYPSTFKIAASLLFLVGIGVLVNMLLFSNSRMLVTVTQGEERIVYLPDSSKVLLNKNSELSYAEDFNESGRTVYLEGEAFFEVRKSQGKKFEVIGVRSVTTVLGTSFSVRSIKGESKEVVQVVTGKVAFADKEHPEENKVLLTPGYKGELDLSSLVSKSEIVDPNFIAWKEDKLTFENEQLSSVLKTIERYFGIKIEVEDPQLLNCRFTGTFDSPKPDEVLDVVALSTNTTYKLKGNKFLLKGKGCTKN